MLDLSYNQLSKIDSKNLGGLSNLRELYLMQNRIAELNGAAIHLSLEHLKLLNVSRNKLYGLDANFFGKLPKLEVLDLSSNSMLHINESHFHNQTNLRRFIAFENGLRTIGEKTFLSMNLELLDMSNNQLEQVSPTAFKNLRCKTLKLSNNPTLAHNGLGRALLEVSGVEDLDLSFLGIENQHLKSGQFNGLEQSLVRLNMSNNLLMRLPKLPNLVKIRELDFSKNRITVISKSSDFNIAEFSMQMGSRQTYLYLQDNDFSCQMDCDVALLKEFDKLSHKCEESNHYCLRCADTDEKYASLKVREISVDVSEEAESACGELISAVRGHYPTKNAFIYFLIFTMLIVILFVSIILLFVFRKKVINY